MLFASPAWDQVAYWALDLETGGLDARRDPIIAVGMVPVRGGVIRVGEAYETFVRPEPGRDIRPESVRAHQLLAGDLERAPSLAEVLDEIDRRLREGALLVHHQSVDVAFLKAAYARHGRRWPKPAVIDTVGLLLKLERKARFTRGEGAPDGPEIRLAEARRAFGLPDYQAHDALTDAVAAAELFLALRKALRARTLRDLR